MPQIVTRKSCEIFRDKSDRLWKVCAQNCHALLTGIKDLNEWQATVGLEDSMVRRGQFFPNGPINSPQSPKPKFKQLLYRTRKVNYKTHKKKRSLEDNLNKMLKTYSTCLPDSFYSLAIETARTDKGIESWINEIEQKINPHLHNSLIFNTCWIQ